MKRIVPGVLIAAFWLLLLLKGSILWFGALVCIVALIGCDEYVKMAAGGAVDAVDRWSLNVLLALPVIGIFFFPQNSLIPFFILISFFGLTGFFLRKYKSLEDSYLLFCRLVFGVIYVGLLGSHLILLRHLPEGGYWLIIASAITSCSDSGAYFVGSAVGKHKLCPNISPNKTVEGALGGVVAGLIGAVTFALLLLDDFSWLFLIIAAILLTFAGIVGDLTESIIKRGTGTKDSGTCLAGHGGILDRGDSLLFAAPVLYYLMIFTGV